MYATFIYNYTSYYIYSSTYIYVYLKCKSYCSFCGLDSKEFACSAGELGLILGLGRSHGEGNGNPLQYSCLENSMTEEPGGLQSVGW